MNNSGGNMEKVLVCVGPGKSTAGVIRAAGKKAAALHAKLFAVYVETPRSSILSEAGREELLSNLRLAEKIDAETITLTGRNIAKTIVDFARERGVSKIYAGKPKPALPFLGWSPVDQLIRIGGNIEVEIIPGETNEALESRYVLKGSDFSWPDYGTAFLFLVLATAAGFLMFPKFHLSNIIMVYLLAVMLSAIECGRGPSIMVAILSVLAFDFCFVPPRFKFTVNDAQYVVTFVVMFLVSLTISHMAHLMRRQTEAARLQERQASAMHGLSAKLASSRSVENTLKTGLEYVRQIFDSHGVILLPVEEGKLHIAAGEPSLVFEKDVTKEMQLARLAFQEGETTGWGTRAVSENHLLFLPLRISDASLGVFVLRPNDPERLLLPDQRHLLESLIKQITLSLEVELLSGGSSGRSA
ncbi:MAG: DUF4118 domain-containing protein [Syntrophobacteraceae bacterium]